MGNDISEEQVNHQELNMENNDELSRRRNRVRRNQRDKTPQAASRNKTGGNASKQGNVRGNGRGNVHNNLNSRRTSTNENSHRSLSSHDHMYGSCQSLPALDVNHAPRSRYTHSSQSNWGNGVDDHMYDFLDDAMSECNDDSYSVHSNESYSSGRVKGGREGKMRMPKEKKVYPRISVYWDIENCQIPRGKSALFLVKRIRDRFYKDHVEDEFVVVCDTRKMSRTTLEELNSSTVSVISVNADSKNAADDALRRKLRDFAERNVPPATVVLITGDINFTADIHDLKHRKLFDVILLHNSHANVALKISATVHESYDEFIANLPEATSVTSPTHNGDTEFKLVVTNLPPNAPLHELKKNLSMKFQGYNGKVLYVNMMNKMAYLRFPSERDAQVARARLNNEHMLGSTIKIHSWFKKKEAQASGNSEQRALTVPQPIPAPVAPSGKKSMVTVKTKNFTYQSQFAKLLLDHQLVTEDLDSMTCIEEGVKWFKIMCPSQNLAKKFVKNLQALNVKGIELIEINAADCNPGIMNLPTTVGSPVSRLKLQLMERKAFAVSKYEAKMEELQKKEVMLMDTSRSSHVGPEARKKTADVNKMIKEMLMTCFKEFNVIANSLLTQLNMDACDYKKLAFDFEVESILFEQFLSIYAHRKDIISTLKKNRIIIVNGTHGCGKSTQLIQYVYYDGFANHGKIVCIEPHKELVVSLGSQVAGQLKNLVKGSKAQVLFTTTHMLLQEIAVDSVLKEYSCIIVDVQEECSLTDLLLACLRSILEQRSDLFVVILSTPSRIGDMTRFFNGTPAIKIDSIGYPIITYWEARNKNYVKQAIEMVTKILNDKDQGDILVILSNPSDVYHGVRLMMNQKVKNVQVTPLLLIDNFKESWKRLQQKPGNGCRNVILTAGGLEAVVTFNGVCFVIDAGFLTKTMSELTYVLKSTQYLSSIQEANVRACKADRHVFGECHRLYTMEKIGPKEEMKSTVQLLPNIILILLKLKMKPMHFEYVHSPSMEEVTNVLECLTKVGAVENNQITALGDKIAFIPLPFHLSLLLYKSMEEQIGYEALLLCSVSETLGSFVDIVTETQDFGSINVMKVTEMYMSWLKMNRSERQSYVQTAKLSPTFFNIVLDKMNEINSILKSNDIKIKMVSTNTEWQRALQKLMMKVWSENLCYWHRKEDGLYMWQPKKTNLKLQRISANNTIIDEMFPSVIIFERLWRSSSGDYIHNYVVIETAFVKDELGTIGLDKVCMENLIQDSFSIRPVGSYLLRSKITGGNDDFLKQLEKNLSQLTNSPVNIVVSLQMGQVVVHVPRKHKETALEAIQSRLKEGRKQLLQELWQYFFCQESGVSILWGAGGLVKFFLMFDEYISILFFLKSEAEVKNVLSFCKEHGQYIHFSIKQTKTNDKSTVQMVVMFVSPAAAKKVFNATLESKTMSAKPRVAKANIPRQKGSYRTVIDISWVRRKNKGTAIVRFTVDTIYNCIGPLAKNIQNHPLLKSSAVVPDFNNFKMILNHINPILIKSEVLAALNECLAETEVVLDDSSLELVQEPAFQSTYEEQKLIQERLNLYLLNDACEMLLFADLQIPSNDDDLWHATLDDCDASTMEKLKFMKSLTWDFPLTFVTKHSWRILCTEKLFDFCVDVLIPGLRHDVNMEKVNVNTFKDSKKYVIKLESSDQIELLSVQAVLAQKFKADTLVIDTETLPGDLFLDNGRGIEFFNALEKNHSIYLKYKKKKKQLTFIGPQSVKDEIEEFLNVETAKLQSLAFDKTQLVPSATKGLFRKLFDVFGPFLNGLLSCTGIIKLDLAFHSLTRPSVTLSVVGCSSAKEDVLKLIGHIKDKLDLDNKTKTGIEDDDLDICPVCDDSVHNCEEHYRLEDCGHAYCMPCMQALVANSMPPIFCLYKDCTGMLVFRDINTFNTKYPQLLKFLEENSLQEFVKNNHFTICPFADCEGLVPIKIECQICPSCFNAVCTICQSLYHYEQTCESFQKENSTQQQDPDEVNCELLVNL